MDDQRLYVVILIFPSALQIYFLSFESLLGKMDEIFSYFHSILTLDYLPLLENI